MTREGVTPGFEDILDEQIRYYRRRADEYDEWFRREGRYDRGADFRRQWMTEIETLGDFLKASAPFGDALEIACGTGLWTETLAAGADSVTALDASPEALAQCRKRVRNAAAVELVETDLFAWEPRRTWDTAFFGFWLSHVPTELFADFWDLVRRCLNPGGRFLFLDSRFHRGSTAIDHELVEPDGGVQTRRLNDGSEFRIVKMFYEPDDLTEKLRAVGATADVRRTDEFFVYGSGAFR